MIAGGMSSNALQSGRGRAVHPIVRLDYFVRIPTSLVVLLTVGSIFLASHEGRVLWALLAFYGFLWPHLAYLVSRRSRDSKAAELRNLLADSCVLAFFVARSGFGLLLCIALLTSINAANVSVGGVRFSLKGLLAMIAGAGASVLLFGF